MAPFPCFFLSFCVCVCVCVCVCMYVCTYVRTYVCVYVCTYVCMYVRMHAWMHVCMYVFIIVSFMCACVYLDTTLYVNCHICPSYSPWSCRYSSRCCTVLGCGPLVKTRYQNQAIRITFLRTRSVADVLVYLPIEEFNAVQMALALPHFKWARLDLVCAQVQMINTSLSFYVCTVHF
jgi:hypothetical protein